MPKNRPSLDLQVQRARARSSVFRNIPEQQDEKRMKHGIRTIRFVARITRGVWRKLSEHHKRVRATKDIAAQVEYWQRQLDSAVARLQSTAYWLQAKERQRARRSAAEERERSKWKPPQAPESPPEEFA